MNHMNIILCRFMNFDVGSLDLQSQFLWEFLRDFTDAIEKSHGAFRFVDPKQSPIFGWDFP